MKILQICARDRGGAAQAAIRLHRGLLSQQIQSSLLFLAPSTIAVEKSTYVDPGASKDFYTRLMYKTKLKRPLKAQQRERLKKMKARFESFSFAESDVDITHTKAYQEADVIHLHWVTGLLDFPSFFRKCSKPVVWTLHDMNPFLGGFHYQGDLDRNRDKMALLNQQVLDVKKNALRNFEALHIVTPSRWLCELSKKSALFGKYPHQHIFNGIDTATFKAYDPEFARSVFDLPFGHTIYLFVSDRLDNYRKGLDILQEAFNLLPAKEKVTICALGEGLPLTNNNLNTVSLSSIYDERLVGLLYAAVDYVVVPSREDNLPNVMVEALSCGTPVVALPVGGMTEVIQTGFNGVLAREISAKALQQALKETLDGKYHFSRNDIRQYAMANFEVRQQAKKYLNVYQRALSSRNKNSMCHG